jgi:hypothetical protein
VNEAAASVIVVAGALMQPLWVPPEELASRLQHLSGMSDLQTAAADLPPPSSGLPRELAHDRWLRAQPELREAALLPGASTAMRRLAPFGESPGWLLEPAHFHLAQDHLVLLAGAADDLAEADARRLAEAIQPLLAEEHFALSVQSPRAWLLSAADAADLQLDCASSEAAAGRNIDGYLPAGLHARRYRKLLNEVQMTWHEHPVNQVRESRGELPINSVWLSGPATPAALAAWNEAVASGRYRVDETLLAARLRDDRFAWLDALQSLDARLAQWLASATPPAILLCGDQDCRWLLRGRSRSRAADKEGAGSRLAALASRLAGLMRAPALSTSGSGRGRLAAGDGLAGMFTERTTSA